MRPLTLLAQQVSERHGFETLIPTLEDSDPNVKGLVAIVLSIKYESEPQLMESLSVIQRLVESALGSETLSWIYPDVVERLEHIAGRKFMGELAGDREVSNPDVLTSINQRINAWWVENS